MLQILLTTLARDWMHSHWRIPMTMTARRNFSPITASLLALMGLRSRCIKDRVRQSIMASASWSFLRSQSDRTCFFYWGCLLVERRFFFEATNGRLIHRDRSMCKECMQVCCEIHFCGVMILRIFSKFVFTLRCVGIRFSHQLSEMGIGIRQREEGTHTKICPYPLVGVTRNPGDVCS
jgi:hypothetical protein